MKKTLIILFSFCFFLSNAQIKKAFKFSTFYIATNGGTSLSDKDVFSVTGELSKDVIETPYDYSFTAGIRKIKGFNTKLLAHLKTEQRLHIVMLQLLAYLPLNTYLK